MESNNEKNREGKIPKLKKHHVVEGQNKCLKLSLTSLGGCYLCLQTDKIFFKLLNWFQVQILLADTWERFSTLSCEQGSHASNSLAVALLCANLPEIENLTH